MPDIISSNLVAEIEDKKAAVAEVLADELAPLLDPLLPDENDPTSTTAALAAVGNAINTTGKYAGKQVFNTTTNILVVATGASAGATWVNAGTGAVAHTPA
jgi:hypothetical protein